MWIFPSPPQVHLFTGLQLLCFVTLWLIQTFKATSILFPIMLVLLIGIRKLLDFVFTPKELKVWVNTYDRVVVHMRTRKSKFKYFLIDKYYLGTGSDKGNPFLPQILSHCQSLHWRMADVINSILATTLQFGFHFRFSLRPGLGRHAASKQEDWDAGFGGVDRREGQLENVKLRSLFDRG